MKEKTVFIIAPPESGEMLYRIFRRAGYKVLGVSQEGRTGVEEVRLLHPSLVIVSSNLGDMSGLKVASLLEDFAVMILSSPQDKNSIADANSRIVVVDYCADRGMLLQAAEVMCRMQETIEVLQEKLRELSRTFEENKLIIQAKGQLMERMHISEDKAHRMLQKTSMEKGVNMAELSERIIQRFGKIQ